MVTVIDYDAGNLRSVETALRHLGATFTVTADPGVVADAERVILPGVGDARAAMERLDGANLTGALVDVVRRGVPFFGICLGTQIILDRSEENDARCLGILPGVTRRFEKRQGRKIPHIGWNTIEVVREHPIIAGIPDNASFYFVHSYYPDPADAGDVVARTDYEGTFPSVLARDNVVATQFHPEKSGEFGLKMLANFLSWSGGA
ncbi:MAG: imidazole glycerol phosphate synthase subunit HisH [Alkalispirochaeta sp.]